MLDGWNGPSTDRRPSEIWEGIFFAKTQSQLGLYLHLDPFTWK